MNSLGDAAVVWAKATNAALENPAPVGRLAIWPRKRAAPGRAIRLMRSRDYLEVPAIDPAIDRSGNVLVAWTRVFEDDFRYPGPYYVQARFWRRGRLTPTVELVHASPNQDTEATDVDIDHSGLFRLAYISGARAQLAEGRATSGLRRRRLLSPGRASYLTVAPAGPGRTLAGWSQDQLQPQSAVETRFVGPGSLVASPLTISDPTQERAQATKAAGGDRAGRAWIAYTTAPPLGTGAGETLAVRVAEPGRQLGDPTTLVPSSSNYLTGELRLVAGGDGRAIVLWLTGPLHAQRLVAAPVGPGQSAPEAQP